MGEENLCQYDLYLAALKAGYCLYHVTEHVPDANMIYMMEKPHKVYILHPNMRDKFIAACAEKGIGLIPFMEFFRAEVGAFEAGKLGHHPIDGWRSRNVTLEL